MKFPWLPFPEREGKSELAAIQFPIGDGKDVLLLEQQDGVLVTYFIGEIYASHHNFKRDFLDSYRVVFTLELNRQSWTYDKDNQDRYKEIFQKGQKHTLYEAIACYFETL